MKRRDERHQNSPFYMERRLGPELQTCRFKSPKVVGLKDAGEPGSSTHLVAFDFIKIKEKAPKIAHYMAPTTVR